MSSRTVTSTLTILGALASLAMLHCSAETTIAPAPTGDPGAACEVTGCEDGFTCIDGVCAEDAQSGACAAPKKVCGGSCVDVASDVANCGGCGTTCLTANVASATCAASACEIACKSGFANCDGQAANGCEANLASNGQNCGACGNVCIGGGCAASACQVFAGPVSSGADGIVVDGTTLYWASDAGIMKAAVGSASATTFYAEGIMTTPHGVVIAGGNIYWTRGFGASGSGSVVTCPLAGCPGGGPTVLASAQNFPGAIASDGTDLYWLNAGGSTGAVMKCALSGCGGSPTALVQNLSGASALAVGGGDAFFTDGSGLRKCATAGCALSPTTVDAAASYGDAIGVNGGFVYYGNGGDRVFRTPLAGGAPQQVAMTSTFLSNGIAFGGTDVFFSTTNGTILKCAQTGCGNSPTRRRALGGRNEREGPRGRRKGYYWTFAGRVHELSR